MTAERARAALAAGALGTLIVGLSGADAGILWIVAAVFTLRAIVGAPAGLAWAIACVGVGLRWGTFALGDLETATRLFGASVTAGAPLTRLGMAAALAGAVFDEARAGGLRSDSWVERGAALGATVALVPLFLVDGPVRDPIVALVWGLAAAAVLAVSLMLHPIARRVPSWLPLPVAIAGVTGAVAAV